MVGGEAGNDKVRRVVMVDPVGVVVGQGLAIMQKRMGQVPGLPHITIFLCSQNLVARVG